VTGGQAYMVGERGPELFVPTAAGRIAPAGSAATSAINVTVNVSTPADASSSFMQRTGAQIGRSVRQALDRADG
jgi:phage-related minor tail protein